MMKYGGKSDNQENWREIGKRKVIGEEQKRKRARL